MGPCSIDVHDSGQRYGYGVRGSYTSVELVFHTDNAFAVAPPDYVGLMCFHPAKKGGISRFCSLYAVHERLRERYPAALERLYQPMLWDRQAEHEPGGAKVLRAPMFRCENASLITRANVSLVRKGYQVAEQVMDGALEDALAAVEEVSGDARLWFELPIARGQLQFLNNVNTAHYRSEFEDFDEPRAQTPPAAKLAPRTGPAQLRRLNPAGRPALFMNAPWQRRAAANVASCPQCGMAPVSPDSFCDTAAQPSPHDS